MPRVTCWSACRFKNKKGEIEMKIALWVYAIGGSFYAMMYLTGTEVVV